MAAGRPTDYTPKILKAAKEYADLASELAIKADIQNTACPSIAELALTLKVARSTIYLWAKEHPEFSDILERIMAAQEMRLTDNGLNGTYNPTIAKVMLTKHGYTDKQDITSDNKPIAPLLVRFLGDDESNNGDTKGV